MFKRKAKAKRPSPSKAIEAAGCQINAAIDEAEKIAGPAAITTLLQVVKNLPSSPTSASARTNRERICCSQ
jgi:hypothetical protein